MVTFLFHYYFSGWNLSKLLEHQYLHTQKCHALKVLAHIIKEYT